MNPPVGRYEHEAILRGMSTHTTRSEDQDQVRLSALIARMCKGDEAALSLFYELTLSRVYGLALKVVRRHDLAEEVCVETFWQAWREAARFDVQRGQPLAWLMMMTRSRALDILRRQDPAQSCADTEILQEAVQAASDATEYSALDLLLCTERDAGLASALQQLTPIQRQMVALAYYKDLSHQEISDHTGLPLGTVKSHLKRAQDGLRAVLCVS